MAYRIEAGRKAAKALAGLEPRDRERIGEAIELLGRAPRPAGCKKLVDRDAWRIRVGRYRVIYQIFDDRLVVLVVDISHRREAYR